MFKFSWVHFLVIFAAVFTLAPMPESVTAGGGPDWRQTCVLPTPEQASARFGGRAVDWRPDIELLRFNANSGEPKIGQYAISFELPKDVTGSGAANGPYRTGFHELLPGDRFIGNRITLVCNSIPANARGYTAELPRECPATVADAERLFGKGKWEQFSAGYGARYFGYQGKPRTGTVPARSTILVKEGNQWTAYLPGYSFQGERFQLFCLPPVHLI